MAYIEKVIKKFEMQNSRRQCCQNVKRNEKRSWSKTKRNIKRNVKQKFWIQKKMEDRRVQMCTYIEFKYIKLHYYNK